jgi:hypothetical protein
MKKGLLAVLIVLFATAAYAEVTFSISGDMFARGNYFRNQDYYATDTTSVSVPAYWLPPVGAAPKAVTAASTTTKAVPNTWTNGHATQRFMDGAIHLYPKIKVDNATINMKVTMHDEIWQNRNTTANITPGTTYNTTSVGNDNNDSNVAIERAWLTYMFTENSILDVGLMDGSVWGSTFADNLTPKYRVKFTQKTPMGIFGALYEKGAEDSNPNVNNALNDEDDSVNYAIFAVTKAGNVWVKPLLFLVNNSSGTAVAVPFRSTYAALQLNGDLGPISFDSEFGYKTWEFTYTADQTYSNGYTYGAYLNIFKAADFGKVGMIGTYGSWDKDAGVKSGGRNLGWGYSSGNDFKSNLIFGGRGIDSTNLVSIPLGVNQTDFDYAGQDLTGFHMAKLYLADIKTGVDKLTFNWSGSWMHSNQKDNMWDGAKAYEFDMGVSYKLSNNVTYSIDGGWGRLGFSKWARNNTVTNPVTQQYYAGYAAAAAASPVAGTTATAPGAGVGLNLENPNSVYAIQHMIKLVF